MEEFEFETYTLSQISTITGIATSTLSDYRNRFSDYIPAKGSGRNRRYTKDAITVFKYIKGKFEEGLRKEQIDELLAKNFPRQVDIPEEYEVQRDNAAISPVTDVIPTNNEVVSLIVGTLKDLKDEMTALREEYVSHRLEAAEERRKLKEEIVFLRQELEKVADETTESVRSVGKQIDNSISVINNTTEKTSESLRKTGDEVKSEIVSLKEEILQEVSAKHEESIGVIRSDTEKRDREVLDAIRELQEKQNQNRPWWKKLFEK